MGLEQRITAITPRLLKQIEIQELRQKAHSKSIHQLGWNIEEYCKIFQIPEEEVPKIIAWFLSIVDVETEKDIKILCPGVGAGRNELKLIVALANRHLDSRVTCDFIDYSTDSCEFLKNLLLTELGFSYGQGHFKKDNIEIWIHVKDYEEWLNIYRKNRYNVILSFFVFNFLSNWRESVLRTISLLKADGILVVSQDLGDLCFLDNTFAEIPNKKIERERYTFFKLWRDYYQLRREYGLDWNNLISPSNMRFLEGCFSDIHLLTNQCPDVSRSFLWNLNDLNQSETEKFRDLDFWITLTEGSDEISYEVFNCLTIPRRIEGTVSGNIREDIAKKLRTDYGSKRLNNLKLGEKLFYIKKPKEVTETHFNSICRYVFDRSNFNISNTAAYKFRNRDDNTLPSKIPLKFALQNRALDIYHCFVHEKNKAMVSMFSKEVRFEANKIKYSWRQNATPLVYPNTYTNENIKYFLISYSLYFLLREQEDYSSRLTGLIHEEFPDRMGIIFLLTGDVTEETIRPIFYRNSSKIKALVVTICRDKFQECKKAIKNQIGKALENEEINNFLEKRNVFDKNFSDTDLLIDLGKLVTQKMRIENLKSEISSFFSVRNPQLPELIIENLKAEYHISLNLEDKIKKVFGNVYLLALSHPVDCNAIFYTTTNIDFNSEKDNEPQEQSYYGLIVADYLPPANIANHIESYYDQLLSNTFSYSGMDGIHEQKTKDKLVKLNAVKAAISQVFARNMSHNHGSHVLSRLIHPDHIESIMQEHEGIRQVLNRKMN